MRAETLIASIWLRNYRRLKNAKGWQFVYTCEPSRPASLIISIKQLNYLTALVHQAEEKPEGGWKCHENGGWHYNGRKVQFGKIETPLNKDGKCSVMIPDVGYRCGEYGFLTIGYKWN